jgi:hypothetical protein
LTGSTIAALPPDTNVCAPRRPATHRNASPRNASPRTAPRRHATQRNASHRHEPQRTAEENAMAFIPSSINAELVRRIGDLLNATPIEGVATYGKISEAIGFDVARRRWLLPAALRLANAETGAIFATQRSIGYQRLPGSEAHALGRHARGRIRRISKSTQQVITQALILTNDLSDDERRRAHSELAALGLIQHLSLDRNMPQVVGDRPMPTPETVRASVDALLAVRRQQEARP